MRPRRPLARSTLVLVAAAVLSTLTGTAPASATPAGSTSATEACSTSNTTVTVATGLAATGHVGFRVHLSNTSRHACSTSGYPRVALLCAGRVLVDRAEPTRRGFLGGLADSAAVPALTLQPGEEATALVEATDVPTAAGSTPCATATTARIVRPGDTGATARPLSFFLCSPAQVHPLLAGTTGTQPR